MSKKEKVFPKDTIGGRIYELRNKLGFNTPSGRVDFYNFLYDNVDINDDSKHKNVYNWECSEDSIPIPVLKKICEKCNCSSDYLIGIEKEVNHDLHFICNYTGLSEDAINAITHNNLSYFPFVASTINFLLEKDNYINDKLELFRLIPQYILSSQNTKSYDECGVPKVENNNISLRDEYGNATGLVPIDKMPNIILLSINELLSNLRNKISTKQIRIKPTIFDILNNMLIDLIGMGDIEKNIKETVENGSVSVFCFDIDNLSRMHRRFMENTKRLTYLYGCDTIDDIDFEKFQSLYPQYDDNNIELLKRNLDL